MSRPKVVRRNGRDFSAVASLLADFANLSAVRGDARHRATRAHMRGLFLQAQKANNGSGHNGGHKHHNLLILRDFYRIKTPLRREGRTASAEPVCSCALLLCASWHTRPRVQRAPGLPCALEGERHANLGRIAPRDRRRIPAVIARSTCDEAIHSFFAIA
jgi:hypothetical protein